MVVQWFDSGTAIRRFSSQADVHVWLIKLDQFEFAVQHYLDVLSGDEYLRAQSFHSEQDRRRFIIAHGSLRSLLSLYVAIAPKSLKFVYGLYGKPFLSADCVGDTIRFNLSHSGELALCAVTPNREVGADIEYIRPLEDVEVIAKHLFSEQEWLELRSLPPHLKHQAFFTCWTRKEAYVKATGKGGSQPLDRFAVSLHPGVPARLLFVDSMPQEVARWSFEAWSPAAGYEAAVAVEKTDGSFSVDNWRARGGAALA